jgi:stage II sporulation protein D
MKKRFLKEFKVVKMILKKDFFKKTVILCLAFVVYFTFFVSLSKAGVKELIIGIGLDQKNVKISSASGMNVQLLGETSKTRYSRRIPSDFELILSCSSRGINFISVPEFMKKDSFFRRTRFFRMSVTPAGNSFIKFNNKQYRGSIAVFVNDRYLLTVVNKLDLEKYLYGVVPKEMLPSSPIEALKAQAVVARTFAVRYMDKCSKEGYNLTNDTSCQVYGGYDAEDQRTNRAVDLTSGYILTYKGAPVSAVYTSVCGGHTVNNEDAWSGAAKSYLRGVPCPYCSSSPKYKWDYQISKTDFTQIFRKKGISFNGDIKSIEIVSRTDGNRVKLIKLVHRDGAEYISGKELRSLIGADKIKSTWFDVSGSFEGYTRYTPVNNLRKLKNRLSLIKLRKKYNNNSVTGKKIASLEKNNSRNLADNTDESKKISSSEELIRNIINNSLSKKKSIEKSSSFAFTGRGHGHGVGMCQSGAAVMAQNNFSYTDILSYYYKDVTLKVIK